MMNPTNKHFELVENSDGHASVKTVMKFSDHVDPFIATNTGPNTIYSQVIVNTSPTGSTEMIYQSLTAESELVAGRAQVTLFQEENKPTIMQLNWQWLTGSLTSRVSVWQEITEQKVKNVIPSLLTSSTLT